MQHVNWTNHLRHALNAGSHGEGLHAMMLVCLKIVCPTMQWNWSPFCHTLHFLGHPHFWTNQCDIVGYSPVTSSVLDNFQFLFLEDAISSLGFPISCWSTSPILWLNSPYPHHGIPRVRWTRIHQFQSPQSIMIKPPHFSWSNHLDFCWFIPSKNLHERRLGLGISDAGTDAGTAGAGAGAGVHGPGPRQGENLSDVCVSTDLVWVYL